ncbi:MAG TPA: alpha-amylase family glycosyl hydrolase [Solirubrobacteraceae bacterium]
MWWRDGVLYQIYPRSFADSDGDGVGDLRGIIEHLDHLAWLGVDGLWMNPTFPSPNADWGFDVSDYRGVHPELGTLEDLDELVARAGELGIRVLLDLVPNHTSDEHPWFRERRDYYVWRDGQDGAPPNNWMSLFGGPAWTRDEATGLWYLHNFDPKQPDLDWWNEDVRTEFDDILRFWFDRGIAGFRIDVAHGIVKDRELRDNPEATADDIAHYRQLGQRPVFSMNRPEVHDVLRHWREVSDPYGAVLVGETYVHDLETLASFYGGDGVDELNLAFNFVFLLADFDVETLAPIVARTEELLPEHAWPVWTLGNHDATRFPTRWAKGDADLARCALMLLLTLRGTPVLYYGDELAMQETPVPPERVVDPEAKRDPGGGSGRDGARTPMPWSDAPGLGFTDPGVEPWLPFGDATPNVADARADPGSALHLTRDLIALRRSEADLLAGAYAEVVAVDGLWVYRRGERHLVALNIGDEEAVIEASGTVALCTNRERDGERVAGGLHLAPRTAAVVHLGR